MPFIVSVSIYTANTPTNHDTLKDRDHDGLFYDKDDSP